MYLPISDFIFELSLIKSSILSDVLKLIGFCFLNNTKEYFYSFFVKLISFHKIKFVKFICNKESYLLFCLEFKKFEY